MVAPLAPSLIVRKVNRLCEGSVVASEQDEQEATYTRMLSKDDGIIDWSDSCRAIHSKVRACIPWPKASTTFEGKQLLITGVYGPIDALPHEVLDDKSEPGAVLKMVKGKGLAVACGDGVLYVSRVQLAQKKEMDSAAFCNGNPSIVGAVLGSLDA